MIEDTEYFLIKTTLGAPNKDTEDSFFRTIPSTKRIKVKTIIENDCREATLNQILKLRNPEKNLFIFVDDIIFRRGWFESLEQHVARELIIGFSMLHPHTNKLQDFGYDFITIDGQLSVEGLHKNQDIGSLSLLNSRECSAVCGCAMWISKEVLSVVKAFRKEGMNRWEELIFTHEAYRSGFKCKVLSSHLFHFGTSTKVSNDVKLGSISWLIERHMWREVVNKFLYDAVPKKKIIREISPALRNYIHSKNKIILYGCGTIADFIFNNIEGTSVEFVSNLKEEIGCCFNGKRVKAIGDLIDIKFDAILITAIGYEEQIMPALSELFSEKVEPLAEVRTKDSLLICLGNE